MPSFGLIRDGRRRMASEASVAICAHSIVRLEQTVECVESVWRGSLEPAAVIVVVDSNVALRSLLDQRLGRSGVLIVDSDGQGASSARNTALRMCRTELLVFIDDDAIADVGWLEEMAGAFDNLDVVGVGGRVVPAWGEGSRPLPAELYWVVGSTYKGHPLEACAITRPIGASMAIRADAMRALGGFPASFGPRLGKKSSSNEELALFTAVRRRWGGECVRYAPGAVVFHTAPASRTTFAYLLVRSWVEGTSKADARKVFGRDVMAYDEDYVRSTLLPGIFRYGRLYLSGESPAGRSAVMCSLALVVTALAYVWRVADAAGTSSPQSWEVAT
jgi:cellulose synthase/poly-beta-1,6-N-acetylglucosamine synthase-like glycosyltransferase